MPPLPPIDQRSQLALRACADDLRRTNRAADALASQVSAVLGASATAADRQFAAGLRRLASECYDAAASIERALHR